MKNARAVWKCDGAPTALHSGPMPLTVHTRSGRPASATDLAPGTAAGDYVIERQLGHGGMGTVYQAIHPVIDKRVAIKVLHHELCANSEAVARFVQEARAVNRIGHPNIVDVFGFGTTEDGRAFLAMDLLTGESLGRRLERAPSLTSREAAHILLEVSYALEAAHAVGIVHRDLKPDNVFLVASRKLACEVRLLDFGIAKLTNDGAMLDGSVTSTQPGMIVGTPQYMAPEQARGQVESGSTDIYALGVMAFEMFAGRPPFVGEDPVELVAKHITLPPPAPSDFNADLPELVDTLLSEMLRKDPATRPPIQTVQTALEQIGLAPPTDHALDRNLKRQLETEVLSGLGASAAVRPPRRRVWMIPVVLFGLAVCLKVATFALDSSADASSIAIPAIPAIPANSANSATPSTPVAASHISVSPVIPTAAPSLRNMEVRPPSSVTSTKLSRRPARKQQPPPPPPVAAAAILPTKLEPSPGLVKVHKDPEHKDPEHKDPEDDDALRNPYDKP